MANKQGFTPEEWVKVLESTMTVGIAVSAADPSGPFGTFKEFLANSWALRSAKDDPDASELVKAVIADFATEEGAASLQAALRDRYAGAQNAAECVNRSLASLREAAAILDAKTPEEAPRFKAWLCHIGQNVAEAASEGGFLGFGGVKISDAEKATLDDIAKALGERLQPS